MEHVKENLLWMTNQLKNSYLFCIFSVPTLYHILQGKKTYIA